MTWKKGESGNPGGRATGEQYIRDLARKYTDRAVAVLVDIMENSKADATRSTAAQYLIDRGWGRPAQTLVGTDDESKKLIPNKIEIVLKDSKPQVVPNIIEHTVIAAHAIDKSEEKIVN